MAGRPRNFDEAEVLAQAMQTFWTHGYEGTGVAELERATGLLRQSLYGAFGDKRRLFMRAVDYYCDHVIKPGLLFSIVYLTIFIAGVLASFSFVPEEWLHVIALAAAVIATVVANRVHERGRWRIGFTGGPAIALKELALGLIAFALDFVPYIGPALAACPALIVALAVSPSTALSVALLADRLQ